jgi:hypothetical protein
MQAQTQYNKITYMPVIKRSELVQSGNVPLPYDRYSAIIKEVTVESSAKAQRPMLKFACEVVAKEPIQIGDIKVDPNGTGFDLYFMLDNDKALAGLLEVHSRLGLPEELDTDSPNTKQYEGICFDIFLKSEKNIKRKPLTEEQRQRGETVGQPFLDAAGKEISLGYRVEARTWDIIGRSATQVAERPY